MNKLPVPALRRRELVLAALAALAGCGGVDSGGTGTGLNATYAAGSITGLGSVIVNGIRFDERDADIGDDDDRIAQAAGLKLGMQIEVVAGEVVTVDGVSTASASSIRVRSEIVGPVEANTPLSATLVVLGQTVEVRATTVFDDRLVGGQAAVMPGDTLAVHATLDVATSRYVATRIEPAPAGARAKLRGVVAAYSPAAGTIRIGTATLDVAGLGLADPASTFAVGRYLRLALDPTPVAGTWTVTAVAPAAPALEDRDTAEVEGRITAFVSTTSFAVNGIEVDARTATFRDGTSGVVLGAKVEVEGSVRSGVLVARSVSIESDDDGAGGFELHGTVASVDAAANRFVLRGVTVGWSASTRFEGGTAADLSVGAKVEVKGRLSPDGTHVDAASIHLER